MEPNQEMPVVKQKSSKSLLGSVAEFFANSFNMSGHIFNKKSVMPYWKLVPLSFILLSLPFTTYYLIHVVKFLNSADASQLQPVTVFISSDTNDLPPDKLLHINIDAQNNSLAFAKVVLSFDTTKVQLSSNPIVNPTFDTIVQVSTMEESNTSGRLTVVAAVPHGVEAPTGVINDFVTFTLSAVSVEPNDIAVVSFVTNEMQIVESVSTTPVVIIADPATYILNPVATPEPTPSPDPTASPEPTASPDPTASPTPMPTASPTPQPTPIPTSSPMPTPTPGGNQPPTVVITNPTDGAVVTRNTTVNIQATANDDVAVSRVEFWVANKKRCTDTVAPYECAYLIPSSPSTLVIQARAYDAQNTMGTNQITVTSSN